MRLDAVTMMKTAYLTAYPAIEDLRERARRRIPRFAFEYLDGGCNVPFQEAAVQMLEPGRVLTEMKALQSHFRTKRDYVIGRLRDMGFDIEDKYVPNSTFYLWLRLECLPDAINDGLNFFQACLKEKVIIVPGIFFDLNPSKRRDLFDSPCHRKHDMRRNYLLVLTLAHRLCSPIVWATNGGA